MQNSADVSVSFLADPFLRDSITALLDLRIRAGAGHQLLDRVEPVDVCNFDVEHGSPSFADPVDAPRDRRGLLVFFGPRADLRADRWIFRAEEDPLRPSTEQVQCPDLSDRQRCFGNCR